jgi:hypothetical protein
VFKPDVSSDERQLRLRQRGTFCFFFTKNWLGEPIFREKDLGNFRPAGGESGRLSRQTPGLEPTA